MNIRWVYWKTRKPPYHHRPYRITGARDGMTFELTSHDDPFTKRVWPGDKPGFHRAEYWWTLRVTFRIGSFEYVAYAHSPRRPVLTSMERARAWAENRIDKMLKDIGR